MVNHRPKTSLEQPGAIKKGSDMSGGGFRQRSPVKHRKNTAAQLSTGIDGVYGVRQARDLQIEKPVTVATT